MSKNNKQLTCFTIGHSTHESEEFVRLLKMHSIQWIVDVRSSPYSQFNPQFNREIIKETLVKSDISYLFLGDLLGARYEDPKLFYRDKRVVDFKKVRELDTFKKGIERIKDGIKQGYIIALMCSEKDPFDCHRYFLVSYELAKHGVEVQHIMEDGSISTKETLDERLLSKYKQSEIDFFKEENDRMEECYIKRNKDIGYSIQEPVQGGGTA